MSTEAQKWYGTGRRKSSIARVWISEGTGEMSVNRRSPDEYFRRESLCMKMRQPVEVTELNERIDIFVTTMGGGLSGQAGAIRHGLARALVEYNPELRTPLKKAGFLTRDARVVERKKYGQPGARKRFQFSKR
jgi:small subunit ribosomal protein S9